MADETKSSWAACKAAMKSWTAPGLMALVHDLYNLSEENRRFLHARLLPDAAAETLASATRRLEDLLSTSAVWKGRFRHADAKRLIDQYEKATLDPLVVAELLVADLEIGFSTFAEVGDFEPMVDHLFATIHRLDEMLFAVQSRPSHRSSIG